MSDGATDIFSYEKKGNSRKLKQTTTAITATGTLPNECFNEQNNGCARASQIFVHFARNDHVLRILENPGHDGK